MKCVRVATIVAGYIGIVGPPTSGVYKRDTPLITRY